MLVDTLVCGFPEMGIPQNRWFLIYNRISHEMDDSGVLPFQEMPICMCICIYIDFMRYIRWYASKTSPPQDWGAVLPILQMVITSPSLTDAQALPGCVSAISGEQEMACYSSWLLKCWIRDITFFLILEGCQWIALSKRNRKPMLAMYSGYYTSYVL